MEALKNYLTEIQSANVSLSAHTPCFFYFNTVKDDYQYRNLLRELEFNFFNEYLQKITSGDKVLWQKICMLYLQQSKNCFILCDKGDISHQNFRFTSFSVRKKSDRAIDKARIYARNFIGLQFESISRTQTLITDQYGGECAAYHWTGKPVQLLEIGHAFFVCGYLLPVIPTPSKLHWINTWFRFFGQSPPSHLEQSLYKMANREQPARFLIEFKEQYQKHMETLP